MVQRAKGLINHPKKYDKVTAAGSASYVLGISFNKDTGESVLKIFLKYLKKNFGTLYKEIAVSLYL